MAAWRRGLARELAELPADFAPESVFFGGGTPTALDEDDLQQLLDLVQARVNLARVAEWTCEANPGTLTAGIVNAFATSSAVIPLLSIWRRMVVLSPPGITRAWHSSIWPGLLTSTASEPGAALLRAKICSETSPCRAKTPIRIKGKLRLACSTSREQG